MRSAETGNASVPTGLRARHVADSNHGTTTATAEVADAPFGKVGARLIPFLFLLYIIAFLDRVNVGYAKLQMAADLKFSDEVYGLGAGMFFIGYFLFEVPSNLVLARVGARIWIARILIVWGLISAGFMFVQTPLQFYAMRFLLGVGEAGFFPGVILYLTYWFPSQYRARVIATFMTAIALAGVIGGPVSGWMMRDLAGLHGLAGWQWLFLAEGLPAVVFGFITLAYLDNGPHTARWLTPQEKLAIDRRLEQDRREQAAAGGPERFLASLGDRRLWTLALTGFCINIGMYGVNFFLPQLIKDIGVKDLLYIGLLSAIPYGVAAVAMVANGRHSDAQMERRWHTAVPALTAAVGLVLAASTGSAQPHAAFAGLTLATAGALCAISAFWSMPPTLLRGSAAAGGIATICSFANLGGLVGPYIMGWGKTHLPSGSGGMYVLATSLVLAAGLAVMACRRVGLHDRSATVALEDKAPGPAL